MRSVRDNLRSTLLLPLLGWTVLGMVVDVVSGPLTPENALGVLCGCVLDRATIAQQDPSCLEVGTAGDHAIVSVPHDSLPFSPPAAVHNATWTNFMIAPHSAQPAAVGVHAGQAVALLDSPSVSPPLRGRGEAHGPGGERLSLQLCRLHC